MENHYYQFTFSPEILEINLKSEVGITVIIIIHNLVFCRNAPLHHLGQNSIDNKDDSDSFEKSPIDN
jgi:hypothetical protein